jgi:hypothetical protein
MDQKGEIKFQSKQACSGRALLLLSQAKLIPEPRGQCKLRFATHIKGKDYMSE